MTLRRPLADIVAALRAPVPRPRPPVAKPQQSWATLREGQRLRALRELHQGSRRIAAGSLFEVQQPTSQGVKLQLLPPAEPLPQPLTWRQKDWKPHFERVRKPAKRRAKREAKEPPKEPPTKEPTQ